MLVVHHWLWVCRSLFSCWALSSVLPLMSEDLLGSGLAGFPPSPCASLVQLPNWAQGLSSLIPACLLHCPRHPAKGARRQYSLMYSHIHRMLKTCFCKILWLFECILHIWDQTSSCVSAQKAIHEWCCSLHLPLWENCNLGCKAQSC